MKRRNFLKVASITPILCLLPKFGSAKTRTKFWKGDPNARSCREDKVTGHRSYGKQGDEIGLGSWECPEAWEPHGVPGPHHDVVIDACNGTSPSGVVLQHDKTTVRSLCIKSGSVWQSPAGRIVVRRKFTDGGKSLFGKTVFAGDRGSKTHPAVSSMTEITIERAIQARKMLKNK